MIGNPQAVEYIKALPKRERVPFERLYPNASKEAIDLLQGVADDPAAHRARLLLAEVLLSRGKRSQAEGWLMKIIDAYNDDRITDRDPQGLGIVGRAAFLLWQGYAEGVAPSEKSLVEGVPKGEDAKMAKNW